MSTTTESRRTDDASFTYGDWLRRSVAVRVTYDQWRRGSCCDAAASCAAHVQGLHLGLRSALEHAGLVASSLVGTE